MTQPRRAIRPASRTLRCFLSLLLASALLSSCKARTSGTDPANASEDPETEPLAEQDGARPGFAEQIVQAHGAGSIYDRPPLHGRVVVEFGGQRALEATVTYDASSGKVRLDYDDGRRAVFDGETAWVTGFAEPDRPSSRFHLLTWPYFIAAPWKLADPGTRLGPTESRTMNGRPYPSARLDFEGEVGDTPDDWYVVYADPDDSRLSALAYIVTYGKTLEEASSEPHAATYDELQMLDNLRVPSVLRYWNWNEESGLVGDPIGRAEFTELRFAPVPPDHFQVPKGADRVDVPDAG